MSRVAARGLVLLSLRRTACLGLCAWATALAGLAILADHCTSAPVVDAHDTVRAGLARQTVWSVFLLGVVPVLVARAVNRAAPWRYGDAPWLATRAVSNRAIAVSTWMGASIGGVALALVFVLVAELHSGTGEALQVLRGSLELPERRSFAAGAPTAWSATLPHLAGVPVESLRIELGLGPGAGVACEVRLRSRGRARAEEALAIGRIGNRGTIEVQLPRNESAIEFELSTTSDEACVYVLSDRGELWSRGSSTWVGSLAIVSRLALALCVWIALALLFSCFVSGTTAVLGVLALWIPLWFSSGTLLPGLARWVPGADLFDALAIVGDGRAPACVGVDNVVASVVIVGVALCSCSLGLRTWRAVR